jgi:hypothetical protein
MNDMRTKQWFVKVCYNGTLLEVREIWSDTQAMAQIQAHKHAVNSLEAQVEAPEETQKRTALRLISELEAKLCEARQWLHDWPEYMDETDEDRAKRRNLTENTREWGSKLIELRQAYKLEFGESSY